MLNKSLDFMKIFKQLGNLSISTDDGDLSIFCVYVSKHRNVEDYDHI